jgi:cellulose synthase/poly-beta-1,6-N-acetylglucosamine synthase-like glycosyltransferase
MTDIEIPVGKRTPVYRFYEMLPAILSYLLLLLPIVLSLINPLIAGIFIIFYVIMWFVKAIAMAYRTAQGYQILQYAQKVDWQQRLTDLEDPKKALAEHHTREKGHRWHREVHYRNLRTIAASSKKYYLPHEVYNAVILPVYKEGKDVVGPTIQSILQSHYDSKNMIFILAYEERAGEATRRLAHEMIATYGEEFYHAEAIGHPTGIPNEVLGKGGNITFAARKLQVFLEEKGIDPDKVIVTTLDADNHPDSRFFAYLTYEYIVDLQHRYRAYQPVSLYLNNIWDVPAPMRVLATGNSFWTIINAQRPHMLRNFSSHAQGMASLIDTDFWSVRTIVEDGHQYWRSYFRFDGHYEVTPIYVPIYQDAVLDETYWKTIKAQFIQLRRWAYGASDIAYVATKGFRKDSKLPFWGFLARFLRLVESHVSWATASIIIAFGAWAPLFLNTDASRSIVAHELPLIASQLQQVAMVGLFITIFLTFKMLPPRPARYKRRRNLLMLLQWVVMPITSIGYGSAAAFYSQTRLLLGKYLDKFDVTVKAVKK